MLETFCVFDALIIVALISPNCVWKLKVKNQNSALDLGLIWDLKPHQLPKSPVFDPFDHHNLLQMLTFRLLHVSWLNRLLQSVLPLFDSRAWILNWTQSWLTNNSNTAKQTHKGSPVQAWIISCLTVKRQGGKEN